MSPYNSGTLAKENDAFERKVRRSIWLRCIPILTLLAVLLGYWVWSLLE